MKILDRYILRTFFQALLVSVVFLVGLYLLIHFFTHLKDLERASHAFALRDYSMFTGLCRYYLVTLPEILVFFGPYAILMASMYTLHHLNQNNELTPMLAAGISRPRVLLPILIACGCLTLGLVFIKEQVVPSVAVEMSELNRLMKGKTRSIIDRLPLLTDGSQNVIDCETWDPDRLTLEKVHLRGPGRPQLTSWRQWQWRQGKWEAIGLDGLTTNASSITDLTPQDVVLELDVRARTRLSAIQVRQASLRRPESLDLQVLFHSHLAYGFSPLILLLLGLPFVMNTRRRGAFLGVGLCLFLSLAFFCCTLVFQRMGSQGIFVTPFLAAWLPVIGFGALGLVLFEVTSQQAG